MTDAEAIEILARWVYTLRVDLHVAQQQAHAYANQAEHTTRLLRQQAVRSRELEGQLRRVTFWMRSGLTPWEIHQAANELDPAVVGATA